MKTMKNINAAHPHQDVKIYGQRENLIESLHADHMI